MSFFQQCDITDFKNLEYLYYLPLPIQFAAGFWTDFGTKNKLQSQITFLQNKIQIVKSTKKPQQKDLVQVSFACPKTYDSNLSP